jgi:hypothetical protein
MYELIKIIVTVEFLLIRNSFKSKVQNEVREKKKYAGGEFIVYPLLVASIDTKLL